MVEPMAVLWQYRDPLSGLQNSGCSERKNTSNQYVNWGLSIASIPVGGCFQAEVAKLVYALDLGSSAARCESSSLSFRTKLIKAVVTMLMMW
jgi:hypothetical protein